jgi:hypothetical protein
MDSDEIDIEVLRNVFNKIFDFIADETSQKRLKLDDNLYWTLSNEERFNMAVTPQVERVGSLVDDYQFLLAAEQDATQAVPLLLKHLAPLLMVLAEKLPNFK